MTDENANTADLTDSEKLDAILRRLDTLETLVEERLKDTRPLWQAISQRTERMEAQLRTIDRALTTFSRELMDMKTDLRAFDERLTEIERRPN